MLSKSFVEWNKNEARQQGKPSDCKAAGLTCVRGRTELGTEVRRGRKDRESL